MQAWEFLTEEGSRKTRASSSPERSEPWVSCREACGAGAEQKERRSP